MTKKGEMKVYEQKRRDVSLRIKCYLETHTRILYVLLNGLTFQNQ